MHQKGSFFGLLKAIFELFWSKSVHRGRKSFQMSVIPELAYIQKSSCELLFFAAPPIESPLNFYRGISISKSNNSRVSNVSQFNSLFTTNIGTWTPHGQKFRRVSSCGDLAPKWRFLRPSGARLLVAIRHLKSGDFGKLVETLKKWRFLGILFDYNTLIGSILRKISKLPSDGQKTKKLGINGHINISKGHQILT